jgi:hypothetical protein
MVASKVSEMNGAIWRDPRAITLLLNTLIRNMQLVYDGEPFEPYPEARGCSDRTCGGNSRLEAIPARTGT